MHRQILYALQMFFLFSPPSLPEDVFPGQWNDEGEDSIHKLEIPVIDDCSKLMWKIPWQVAACTVNKMYHKKVQGI